MNSKTIQLIDLLDLELSAAVLKRLVVLIVVYVVVLLLVRLRLRLMSRVWFQTSGDDCGI